MATHRQFRSALKRRFAKAAGRESVIVFSHQLLDEVTPGWKRRRSSIGTTAACIVMWMEAAKGNAKVLHTTSAGRTKDLWISYGLPRPSSSPIP